jgi:hypothetical protein
MFTICRRKKTFVTAAAWRGHDLHFRRSSRRDRLKLLRLASRGTASPWDALQGSEAPLIVLSERVGCAPGVPLLPQSVPLLAEFLAVLPALSQRDLEARQLGFDRRQLSL